MLWQTFDVAPLSERLEDRTLLAATITGISDNVGTVTGNVAGGGSSDDPQPSINGTSDVISGDGVTTGVTVRVTNGVSVQDINAATDGGGNWSIPESSVAAFATQGAVTVEVDDVIGFVAAEDTVSYTFDTVAPTVTIGAPSAADTNSGPVTYTITYGGADAVTLANPNVTLNTTGTANGTVNVTGSGTATRTVTISGITGDGTLGITLAAGTASDTAGNTAPGSGPSTTFNVDNVAPAPVITTGESDPTNADPISFSVDFQEVVSGFLVGEITVGNGSASNLMDLGAGVYSFDVSPTADGTVTVDIGASVAQDAAGNNNTAAAQFSIVSDQTGPTQTTNAGITVEEGFEGTTIGMAALEFEDVTSNAANVTYTLDSVPSNGDLKLSGGTLSAGQTFTQDDINNNRITYDHDGSETTSDAFQADITDALGNATNNQTFNITVTASDTEVTLAGNTLTITDVDGGSSADNLTISFSGGTYTITDTGGLHIDASSITGSSGNGTSTVTVPQGAIDAINVNVLGGGDSVTVNSVQASLANGLTITGGGGTDTASLNASGLNVGSLNVSAEAINQSQAVTVTGTTSLTATTSGTIALGNGSNDFQGNVTIVSGGATTITDTNALTISDSTTSGTTSITAGTSLTLNELTASGQAVTLTATTGSILDGNGGTNNVTATSLTASAATGIDLDTTITTLTSATTTGTGAINISDSAGGLTATTVSSNDGSVTLNATGGDLTIGTILTAGGNHNALLTTTTSGDVILTGTTTVAGNQLAVSSAGAIDGAGQVTSSTLNLIAATGIGSTTPLATTVGTVAATTGSGDIALTNTGGLIIGTVTTVGASITGGSVGDDINISASSPLTVNSPVSNSGGGDITLTASGAAAGDDLTLNATVTASGGNGSVTLNAGDSIIQNAAGDLSASGSGALDYNAGTGTSTGVITMSNGAVTSTSTGLVTMDADGTVALGRVVTGNTSTAAVTITTNANVTDAGNTGGEDIDAASGRIVIDAASGVGNGNAIETDAGTLDIDNATSGNIEIVETNSVGIVNLTQATAGNIDFRSATGTTTVTAGQSGVSAAGAGTITLFADGGTGDLTVNDTVGSDTGNITLRADDNVTFGAGGDVSSNDGNIEVTADFDDTAAESGGRLDMANGTIISSGTGTIDLNADERIRLGSVQTGSTASAAITIDSDNNAVEDVGNTDIDIVASGGGGVVIRAENGIGSGNALEVNLVGSVLAAENIDSASPNSTTGNIEITDATGADQILLGTVDGTDGVRNNGSGTIVISNTTAIRVDDDVRAGGDITITVLDTTGSTDNLFVDTNDTAGTDDVDIVSTSGSITLNAGDDATINGDLTASATNQTVTINIDPSATDADSAVATGGGTLQIATATSVITTDAGTFINGGNDNDTFDFPPQTTTSFTVDGNPPVFGDADVPPGDTIDLDFTNVTEPPTLTTGVPGSGGYSFTPADGEQFVNFASIETVLVANNSVNYHLEIDPTLPGSYGNSTSDPDNTPDAIEVRLNGAADGGIAGTELIIERAADAGDNGGHAGDFAGNIFRGTVADILSLTINGTGDDETLTINETNGLPDFDNAGGFDAVSPTAQAGLPDTWREIYFDGTFGDTQLDLQDSNTSSFLEIPRGTTGFLDTALSFNGAGINTRSSGLTGSDTLGAVWGGTITVGAVGSGAPLVAGDITFGTSSDDGSVLWIDLDQNGSFELAGAAGNERVVDNLGSHGTQNRVGTVNLAAGTYFIAVGYYDLGSANFAEARFAQGTVAQAAYGSMTVINPADAGQTGLWHSAPLDNVHLRNATDDNDQAEILFIGRGGDDAINYTLGSGDTVNQTYAIGDGVGGGDNSAGGNAEGAILTTDVTNGDSQLLYFTGLEPITINGSSNGGRLTVLGDDDDNLINIENAATAHTSITASSPATTQNNGVGTYEVLNVAANAFSNIDIYGMGGADSIDLIALDENQGSTMAMIRLDGDDTLDGDTSNDTIRVRSYPAGNNVSVFGGQGDDTINVFDAANTVDDIFGRMIINGEAGTDTAVINDSGSNPAGDDGETVTVAISADVPSIEGIFGEGAGSSVMGTDILISDSIGTTQGSIETLTVSTSADNDDINVNLGGNTNTDLTTITINGSGGSDLFNIQSDTPATNASSGAADTFLNGNAGADQFFFETGQFVVNGQIDGGAGNDALDYSAYGSARSIQLNDVGSTDGFQGVDASTGSSIVPPSGNGFDNIDIMIGTSSDDDVLTGANLRNHWDIGGDIAGFDDAHFGLTGAARTDGGLQLVNSLSDAGVIVADETSLSLTGNASTIGRPTGANPITPDGAEQDLAFTSFQNLVGALAQDDRFDLRDGASITGTIGGRGHGTNGDSIDYRDWSTAVSVDLNTGTATNVMGGAAGGLTATGGSPDDNSIENAFGGDAADTIYGDDDNNILGDGLGADELIGDRAREGVDPTGITSGDDTFRLEPQNGVTDVVYDLAGNDTVDFRFASQAIVYDADIVGIQDVFDQGNAANVDLRLHDTLVAGFIPQPTTGNTPFENVVGSQSSDTIDIDPLSISGNFPTNIPVNRFVDGNSPVAPTTPGDTLNFDAQGQGVVDTGLSLTAQGVGTVAYRSIETMVTFNDAVRIIDNGDDAFTVTPAPTTSTNDLTRWNDEFSTGFANDYTESWPASLVSGNAVHTATWNALGVANGLYRVSITWPDLLDPGNPASDVPVQVYDGDTLLGTFTIDQRVQPEGLTENGVVWEDLGIFTFSNNVARIVMTSEANGHVYADAVRIEQISSGPELRVEVSETNEYVTDDVTTVSYETTLEQPLTRTFTLRNEGTSTLTISDVDLFQGTGTNWQIDNPPTLPLMLTAGQSHFVSVTLLATEANGQADFPAELRIFSDDADENVVQLLGQGVDPDPDNDPLREVDPFTVQLDGVVTNVTLIDDGDDDFEVIGVWESGSAEPGFQNDQLRTIADGDGDRAIWTFTGLPDGNYRVSTSFDAEETADLSTSGDFRIRDEDGQIGSATIDFTSAPNDLNAHGTFFEDLGGPYAVTGGTLIVELRDTVAAGEVGKKVIADVVRIERLRTDVADARLLVDINGMPVDIADDSGTVDFGTVFPGSQKQKTFTVTNVGATDLVVREPISLPSEFVLISFNGQPPTNDTEVTLSNGQSVSLVVQLNASTVGEISGELSFPTGDTMNMNADPDENPFNLTLTANVQNSIIVDNQSASGFSTTGSGFTLFDGGGGYLERYHTDAGGGGGDTAVFTFSVDATADTRYRVGTTWASLVNRTTLATYRVEGVQGGPVDVVLNQQNGADDRPANGTLFEDLGVFLADGSGTITVTLMDSGDGVVVADAVRVESLFGPEIEVTDNATSSNLQTGVSSISLGQTTQGGANLQRTFTISNDGERDLALGPVTLPTNYQVSGTFPTSVASGGSTTFTVELVSTNAGTYGGQVRFANDDSDESPFIFNVTGTVVGVVPANQIIDNSDTAYSSTGSFALVSTGGRGGSFEQAHSSRGTGTATWPFTGLTPNGLYTVAATWTALSGNEAAAPYEVVDASGTTAISIDQRQSPDDFTDSGSSWELLGGTYIANGAGELTVRLTGGGADGGYVDADAIRVEKVGAQPEIVVRDPSNNVIADGGSFDFGTTPLGTPVTRTFTVQNANPTVAAATQLSLGTLILPSGFTTTYSPQIVNGNSSITFDITYLGNSATTGVFTFLTNDSDENPFSFTLTGATSVTTQIIDDGDTGMSPFSSSGFVPSSVPGEAYLDDVQVSAGDNSGDTASWTFNGLTAGTTYQVAASWNPRPGRATNAPYTISGIVGGDLTIDLDQTVPPGSFSDQGQSWEILETVRSTSTTITVSLSDDADGFVVADAIRLEPLGTAVPEIIVHDSGQHVADGGTLDFGTVNALSATAKTLTIVNSGQADLILQNPVFPTGFSSAAGFTSTTLNPGDVATLEITVDTSAEGTLGGTVSFNDNDGNEAPYNFTVSAVVAGSAPTIIDNGDPGTFVGSPDFIATTGQGFGDDVAIDSTLGSGGSAAWTFSGLTAGQFRVSATWTSTSNRATNAPFQVAGVEGGPVTVLINQTLDPNDLTADGADWEDLGFFEVTGSTLTVSLGDAADGSVVADAIRIQPIVGPEVTVLESTTNITSGDTVSYGNVAPLTANVTKTFTVRNDGTSDLILQPISAPTGFTVTSGDFTVDQVLASGASVMFDVEIDTSVVASLSGTLTFGNSDLDENPFAINLAGEITSDNFSSIIDDGDSGFNAAGFSIYGGQGFQNDIHIVNGPASGATATWAFTQLVSGGRYRVSATWTPGVNRATDSPFTISGVTGGPVTIDVNQQQAPDDRTAQSTEFEDLGVFELSGTTLTVSLSNDANGLVVADAIRIELVTDAEIEVLDGSTLLDDGVSTVDYGTVSVGDSSTKVYTVRNDGAVNLTLQPVSVPTGYTIVSDFTAAQTVVPGASATFEVSLDTTTAGTFTGTISFANSDSDENPFDIPVTGTVESPQPLIIDDGDAGFASSGFNSFSGQGFQSDIQFASAGTGTKSTTYTFNNLTAGGTYLVSTTWTEHALRASDAPYAISGVTVPQTVDVNQKVAPDDRTVSGVAFEDIATVTLTGTTLTVTLTDDADGVVIADAIRIEPIVGQEIEVLDGVTVLTDGISTVDFGTAAVGGAVSKTFTVKNIGASNLTVQPVSVPTGFTITSDLGVGQVIGAASSATFEIAVDTSVANTFSGTLSFANDDSDENPFNFTVTAVVESPQSLLIDDGDSGFASSGFNSYSGQGFQSDIEFASAGTGTKSATYTFTNLVSGGTYLVSTTWTEHALRASDAPYGISGVTVPQTVEVNQKVAPDDRTVSGVAFEDLATVTLTGTTLTVTLTDDADGVVIADAIRIEPIVGQEIEVLDGAAVLTDGSSTVDFGTVAVGGAVSKTFTVKNIGASNLTVQPVSVPTGFTISSDLGAGQVIGAASSATFEIAVDTSVANTFSGELSFASDDSDENPFNFTVTAAVETPQPAIIDDGDSGFASSGFNSFSGQGFQSDIEFTQSGTGSKSSTYSFTGLVSGGTYLVSATWTEHALRASDAPYGISGVTVPQTVDVNQKVAPDDRTVSGVAFEDLATVTLTGTTLTVTLTDDADGVVIADAIRIEVVPPLKAAGGAIRLVTGAEGVISESDLPGVTSQAIAIWAASGLTAEEVSSLDHVAFSVGDLSGNLLAVATPGIIYIDADAAGLGWFVDQTPATSMEFFVSESGLVAVPGGAAAGRVDLLTVVLHELGHVLGLSDLAADEHPDRLMTETLSSGTRRLPDALVPFAPPEALRAYKLPEDSQSGDSEGPDSAGGMQRLILDAPALLFADRSAANDLETPVSRASSVGNDKEQAGINALFAELVIPTSSDVLPLDVL